MQEEKSMNTNRKDRIKSFYEPKLDTGLSDYQILGWESKEAQNARFEAFEKNVPLMGKSLLDVGCGLCNLLEYLEYKGIQVEYTGVDISEKMIECAGAKGLKARLFCSDIFEDEIFRNEKFDIVYTSGIFNLNLGNNEEFLKKAIKRFFGLCNEVIAFSLLHADSPDREDKYFYFSPQMVQKIIAESECVFNRIEIVEGYLGNDFTVICRK